MPASHFILMIESDPSRSETLATQLVRLGVEPIRVSDLSEALAAIESKHYVFAAVILPADLPGKPLHKAMKSMRLREPVLPAMAYGKKPEAAQAKLLRDVGVLLALWEGYDEGMLLFQVNRLVSGDSPSVVRESHRAPIHTPIRVIVGGREKSGVLYSLSEGGCFIESARASMEGARLNLLFDLDGRSFEIEGVVIFANVPGNLQRPNLPLGMGVRFDDVSPGAHDRISQFVRDRMEMLEI